MRVGRHAHAGAVADDVGWHVEVGAADGIERHQEVVLAGHDEVQRVVVLGNEQILPHVGDHLIGQDRHRRPEPLRQVERVDRQPEGLLHRRRRQHDRLEVAAVARVARDVELALAGRAGDAADRPHAHRVDHHQRNLVGDRPPVGVVHQRIARPRRRCHRLQAAQAGAGAGVHAGQLVLALHVIAADLGQALGHVLGDVGGRRDRVAGEDAAAGGDRPLGQRVGAGLQQPPPAGGATRPLGPGRHERFLDAGLQRAHAAPFTLTSMQKSGQI